MTLKTFLLWFPGFLVFLGFVATAMDKHKEAAYLMLIILTLLLLGRV